MKTATFNLINAIKKDGLDNSEWGLIKDIESTKEHFGTDRDEQLKGSWLYVYLDTNKTYDNLYFNLIHYKAQMKLKSIWYKTEQPNIYIVLTNI